MKGKWFSWKITSTENIFLRKTFYFQPNRPLVLVFFESDEKILDDVKIRSCESTIQIPTFELLWKSKAVDKLTIGKLSTWMGYIYTTRWGKMNEESLSPSMRYHMGARIAVICQQSGASSRNILAAVGREVHYVVLSCGKLPTAGFIF